MAADWAAIREAKKRQLQGGAFAPSAGPKPTETPTIAQNKRFDLVLDIEAIVDPDCPPPPPKEGDDPKLAGFPAPPHWQVVSIGLGWVDRDGPTVKFENVAGEDEAAKLRSFVALFRTESDDPNYQPPVAKSHRIIGWNSRGFDCPVLAHRCMRHGIAWPWYWAKLRGNDPRYRFDEGGQMDLMDWLSDHRSARTSTQDSAARLVGLPGKMDVTGGHVETLHRAGELDAIDRYCLNDVAQLTLLHFRLDLVRGRLSLGSYREVASAWRDAVASTPGPDIILSSDRFDAARVFL